jgi:hypothetical protein
MPQSLPATIPNPKKIVVARIRRNSTRKGEFHRASMRKTELQKLATFVVLYSIKGAVCLRAMCATSKNLLTMSLGT